MATHLPKAAPPLTSTVRHAVYREIDPSEGLKDAATGLSVLVTGSGRGVGRSEALAFAEAGAQKVVITSRSEEELREVRESLGNLGKGCEVVMVACDLTDPASVDNLFKEAGDVDVLVNNAGYLEPCVPIRDSNPDDWMRTQRINIDGTFLATRAFLRSAASKGWLDSASDKKLCVINTSSIGSAGTRPGFSGGKSQINRFTEFLHFEEPSVRTFAMHPGGVMTKLARDSMPPDTHGLLNDSPDLAAGFAVWLATQSDADFLRGRYVSANFDVSELLAKKGEIVQNNLLWTRVVGQEQVMPNTSQVHIA
ncbi:putative Oxidoreductase, short chain dehydrogenase/reductase family [Rhodotorula toruloides ATCC 204091]|uniref:Putative Oxidoreductase n=1 Tax=Rhodotorula toruloides TaxID=5286 RepID=A0A0K3CPE9_RHOTO|nr:putative Oxidoreductase, short chain dehydrogenase/reductase family [Rhodotorula toruloides ATCC 204091]KAK4330522.1 putative Oxidoreductase, short chain dehydrogenase/reductase family [Rhodotorula toruloides]PRQ71205.1 putative Oxidoreductase [Rhodotorula toruloides]